VCSELIVNLLLHVRNSNWLLDDVVERAKTKGGEDPSDLHSTRARDATRDVNSPWRTSQIDDDLLLNGSARCTSDGLLTRSELKLRDVISRRERLERRSRSLESRSESNRVPRVDVEGLDVLRDVTGWRETQRGKE